MRYRNDSKLEYTLPAVPGRQGAGLVFAHDQHPLHVGQFVVQLLQGIERVSGAGPQHFARVDDCAGQVLKRKTRHGEPVFGTG